MRILSDDICNKNVATDWRFLHFVEILTSSCVCMYMRSSQACIHLFWAIAWKDLFAFVYPLIIGQVLR